MSIVPTNVPYSSFLLQQNLSKILQDFPFINVQTVGLSALNRPIYAIRLGVGEKQVFYSASIHANEWITSVVLMKFIEDYSNAFLNNQNLYGYSVRSLYRDCSIYLMPMVNPDGVDLVTGNLDINSLGYQNAELIASNYDFIPFPSRLES